jgi:choloylglycine hydrolase
MSDVGACTTLCIRDADRIVFGQNYDWYVAEGALLVNRRGVRRKAWAPQDRALEWTSVYGSVTFNQYGRGQPIGGMNETGLVVTMMWVNGTGFPAPDARHAVGGGTGWVQYQLDVASSVPEVVASDSEVRIPRSGAPLHYLVADRHGRVAAIEFREGKMVARTDTALVVPALANDFYDDSVAELKRLDAAGALSTDRIGTQSRFVRAAMRAAAFRAGADPVQYVFDTLHDVAQGKEALSPAPPAHITQWSIVYEIDRLRVHFRTRRHPAIKTLDLGPLDFSCVSPVLGMDVHQSDGGDVLGRLRPYTSIDNVALVRSTWGQTGFLKLRPLEEMEYVGMLPYQSVCVAAPGR